MESEKMPADWAIERVHKILGLRIGWIVLKHQPESYPHAIEFARYIEAHEKPPVDRKLLCAREAIARSGVGISSRDLIDRGFWDGCDEVVSAYEAITLYEEGFGQ